MSKNRMKQMIANITSRAEMETLVGEMTALKNELITTMALIDRRKQAIDNEYEDALGEIETALKIKMTQAAQWAETHPDEFGKAKSIEMLHGKVGWRIGQPTLKPIKGWTWDRVLCGLRDLAKWTKYVRTKEEVNKEAILNDRGELVDQLRLMGVQVTQDEVFFVEPKLTDVTKRETTVAA